MELKSHLNYVYNCYITDLRSYQRKLKHRLQYGEHVTVDDFKQFIVEIPYYDKMIAEMEKVVDDTRLTRSEYKCAKELISDYKRDAKMSYESELETQSQIFKMYLWDEFMSPTDSNAEFDLIYEYAYSEGHSQGYQGVYDKFEHYEEFFRRAKNLLDKSI